MFPEVQEKHVESKIGQKQQEYDSGRSGQPVVEDLRKESELPQYFEEVFYFFDLPASEYPAFGFFFFYKMSISETPVSWFDTKILWVFNERRVELLQLQEAEHNFRCPFDR